MRKLLARILNQKQKIIIYGILKELPLGKKIHQYSLVRYYTLRSWNTPSLNPIDVLKGKIGIVIDLGANVGEFTSLSAGFAQEVHAFEPDPDTFETLNKNCSKLKNVHLYNYAAGAKEGDISFFKDKINNEKSSLSSSIFSNHSGISDNLEITVKQVDIIEFLDSLDCDIDIIKIDVEGAECDILEKLIESKVLKRVKSIYVETHENALPELAIRTENIRNMYKNVEGLNISFDWR